MTDSINPIQHASYNKITDDIMVLAQNAILRMNVNLYSFNRTYGKISYHREYEYYDNNSNSNMITIKRSYDYYLSIENIKNVGKEFIRIGIYDIGLVRQSLNYCVKWFVDKEFDNLYGYSKDKLIMLNQVMPVEIKPLPMGKYMILEPIIVECAEISTPGVRLYLSCEENFVEIPLHKFMGFVAIMNSIDIFMCAQNMLNYLGRPEFGTNIYTMPNNQPQRPQTNGEYNMQARKRNVRPTKRNKKELNFDDE